eukprot:12885701-Prorocentrum_lima.AAC.1
MSNEAEFSFNTCAMGTCWKSSPRLSSILIPCWIPATILTNSASHDASAVRSCFPDHYGIRLGP